MSLFIINLVILKGLDGAIGYLFHIEEMSQDTYLAHLDRLGHKQAGEFRQLGSQK